MCFDWRIKGNHSKELSIFGIALFRLQRQNSRSMQRERFVLYGVVIGFELVVDYLWETIVPVNKKIRTRPLLGGIVVEPRRGGYSLKKAYSLLILYAFSYREAGLNRRPHDYESCALTT